MYTTNSKIPRIASYFTLQNFLLRLSGISFNEHETIFYRIMSKIMCLCSWLYPFLAIGDVFKYEFEIVTELIMYDITLLAGILKATAVLLNRKKIANILNHLDGQLNLKNFLNGNDKNKRLMKTCILITTAQANIYRMVCLSGIIFAILASLTTRIRSSNYQDWKFPYGSFTIVNVTYSPNFEISWFYQCFSVLHIGTQFMNIDLLIATVLCHICFHLRILQNNLKTMVEDSSKRMLKSATTTTTMEESNSGNGGVPQADWNSLRTSLKEQVEYHLRIINTIKKVEESFSVVLLLVFFITLAVQACLVYRASLIPLTDVRILRSVGEVWVPILQVFLVCFWSEELMFESERVGYAAYESNFVGTDIRFQRSLILIMRRSQYPIRLTAVYVDVSLVTFVWILRTSFSYFTILSNYHSADN